MKLLPMLFQKLLKNAIEAKNGKAIVVTVAAPASK